jgi:hypothetical protein
MTKSTNESFESSRPRAAVPLARRLLLRVTITLAAWLVAFLVVLGLLSSPFGAALRALPPAVDALVFTGVLVPTMGNLVMPILARSLTRALGAPRAAGAPPAEHARLPVLPEWPLQTVGVLVTTDGSALHAIPISAPIRAGGRRILFSLQRGRGSLARLRADDRAAIVLLARDNVALTARGRARIVDQAMPSAPDHAAIALDVEQIDDHRQAAFVVEAGVDRRWLDERERDALRARVAALSAAAKIPETAARAMVRGPSAT